MDDELFGYIVLATAVLAGVILLLGSLVSSGRRRGVSDWVMIGGITTSFIGIVAILLLIFVAEPYRYGRGDYEFWKMVVMMVGFAIPGGLVLFSGGFLLSRFEARRQTAQLDMIMLGFQPAPGSSPHAGPPLQPPSGVQGPPPSAPPGPPPGAGPPQ